MPPPLRLQHIHIPHPIPYTHSLDLQSHLLNRHWLYRTHLKSNPSSPLTPPPPPTLLTFQTNPTYTVGRRHLTTHQPLTHTQIQYLTANGLASFHASPRGGLLTYHGPGQLTAYAIIDLRRHNLGARRYVRILEESVVRTCAALGVGNAGVDCTEKNPGVWILDGRGLVGRRKVCAVGVRVERGVSSHGVGLNVFDRGIEVGDEGRYVDEMGRVESGYLSWGFGRIVACGLEGKETSWLGREGMRESVGVGNGLEEVAGVLARKLVEGLNEGGGKEFVEGVEVAGVEEVSKLGGVARAGD